MKGSPHWLLLLLVLQRVQAALQQIGRQVAGRTPLKVGDVEQLAIGRVGESDADAAGSAADESKIWALHESIESEPNTYTIT